MPKKTKDELEDSKITQVLLAGLLLQGEPKPDLHKLEELLKLRHGTLSKIYPQRPKAKSNPGETKEASSNGNAL